MNRLGSPNHPEEGAKIRSCSSNSRFVRVFKEIEVTRRNFLVCGSTTTVAQ